MFCWNTSRFQFQDCGQFVLFDLAAVDVYVNFYTPKYDVMYKDKEN